jgi:hypothetical protein
MVGHFTFGVGVALGSISGGGGIVTLTGLPSGMGDGAALGTTDGSGIGTWNFCS